MLSSRLLTLLLAVLLLAGCSKSPSQKLEDVKKLSRETQATAFFFNVCANNFGNLEKITAHLAKSEKIGIAYRVDITKLPPIPMRDEVVAAWGVVNPVNADKFAIIVTKRSNCLEVVSKMDSASLRSEFKQGVDRMTQGQKLSVLARSIPSKETAGDEIDTYFVALPNLAIGPRLSVSAPQKPGSAAVMMFEHTATKD